VEPEHLLLGIAGEEQKRDHGSLGFYNTGTHLDNLRESAKILSTRDSRSPVPSIEVKEIGFSLASRYILERSATESKRLGLTTIGPEYILAALLSEDHPGPDGQEDNTAQKVPVSAE